MPPTTFGPNICIMWYFPSCFLKKIFARYARSTALYKISVLEIWNLAMQHDVYVQSYFSFIVDQLPKCTKTHVKLHKIAYKMSKYCLRLGVLRPCSWLRIGSNSRNRVVLSAGTLPWTRWGSLQRSPRSPVVEGAALRHKGGIGGYRRKEAHKWKLLAMLLITSHVALVILCWIAIIYANL